MYNLMSSILISHIGVNITSQSVNRGEIVRSLITSPVTCLVTWLIWLLWIFWFLWLVVWWFVISLSTTVSAIVTIIVIVTIVVTVVVTVTAVDTTAIARSSTASVSIS